jgi:hypothetical protein
VVAVLFGVGASDRRAQVPYPLENERFGVGLAGPADEILAYDLEALGADWYVNWGAALDPPHPNGAPFVQTIRLNEGTYAPSEGIVELVQANPGGIWQIGNEPDSVWMDNTTPQQYADAYYELYHLIKDTDPTAQVAFGGLVQATPLRMRYLDLVWQAYQELDEEEEMPVDVWTVHGFILREARTGWGAGIPPGMDDCDDCAEMGMDYQIRDHDRLDIFAEQIVRFRQWMADHDQREKPLWVPEYGILMWSDILDEDGEDFSDDRVIAFMHGTFDYFLTATDEAIGYPGDGHRLVQAWAWYSLDDNIYHDGQSIGEGYNGDLFTGPYTKTITALGRGYGEYVVGDLAPGSLQFDPSAPLLADGGPVTATASVVVSRIGGLEPVGSAGVWFWVGEVGQGEPAERRTVGPLAAGESVEATAVLTFAVKGSHRVTVQVDPDDGVLEVDEENNDLGGSLLVASARVYLPAVLRGAAD